MAKKKLENYTDKELVGEYNNLESKILSGLRKAFVDDVLVERFKEVKKEVERRSR